MTALNMYKWCCSGPSYIRSGVCFASTKDNVKVELRNKGFIVNEDTIVEELDQNELLHVISETTYRTQLGCGGKC